MNSWPVISVPPLATTFDIPQIGLMDTASGSIKTLAKKDLYKIYVCGITPYDATHLGHAATYLTFDLINRYLRLSGAQVKFVQNITDIDDPLLERANRDGVDWKDLALSQIELFQGDMVNLHIIPPDHYIGVVEAMPLVTAAIEKLAAQGSTYLVDQDLYFAVRSDSHFGSRSHLSEEQMLSLFAERGGDPKRAGKRDPLDALLWLGEREGEPSWPSPYGVGRPGWHIECCAIALHYLETEVGPGATSETAIDIQGGGSDLIFPHHEMSAAQAQVLQNREFASHYVHAGMIGLDGVKMSKSLGNLVFVSKLVASGVDPMAIRWALMESHYSEDRMWSDEILSDAQSWLDRLRGALSRMEVSPTEVVVQGIIEAQSNNLDTPQALALIKSWIDNTEKGSVGGQAGELSRALDTILGIAL
jgi:L-cysteine:1D-myo-inositol 2-amino-2-deoxy-alpha-D-glucopyranoside ligase